jgi:hypothetical protein
MFDPTSLAAIVVFSLAMPVFTFIAVALLLIAYRQAPSISCRLLGSKRARLYSSLRVGIIVPLLYLLPFVLIRFVASRPLSLSEILVKVFVMFILCIPGTYVGITAAGWIFGPKAPTDSPDEPPEHSSR